MVNLTTLAPDIVEAILDDQVPPILTLFDLAVDPPKLWSEQRMKNSQICMNNRTPEKESFENKMIFECSHLGTVVTRYIVYNTVFQQ